MLEIFRRIGVSNRYFVEFGSANGKDGNTVLFLKSGWRGLWMDGNKSLTDAAARDFAAEVNAGRLTIRNSFITAENIEGLFRSAHVLEEFDLLSIDIDRNDYYVWEAIRNYHPRTVIIEYNAIFPAAVDWVVEYRADRWWDGTSHFGASLRALERLGASKGYALVGCNISGSNAFFVRHDLVADRFAQPFTAENHYEPPRYFLSKALKVGHPRSPSGACRSLFPNISDAPRMK
jgi:hypothetical protein